jgi:L-alanine-DL-glutamate epimerase-like enolase superfamily enzyme
VVKRRLSVATESWPIQGRFTISRGSVTAVELVVVTLSEGDAVGRGECRPYPRYGESPASVTAEIEVLATRLAEGLGRAELQGRLHPGAARNALDCALWDLEAKLSGRPAWELAGLPAPRPLVTAYTLSLDTPDAMARAAAANASRPLLKLKLAGEGDLERVAAVRQAAPASELIVDANEGWTVESYRAFAPALAALGVAMIEQPLPATADEGLRGEARPVPLCADESAHARAGLERFVGLYDLVNVKLDKTGGLTEALAMIAAARALNLGIMVGCMVATSLAMAPAVLAAQGADYVDLDGPLLLAEDRAEGLEFRGSTLQPPNAALWG